MDVLNDPLAIERICSLFGSAYANVQPHSGAQANTAVFFALLQPGDTIMGLDLANGGHLTHGMRINYSGKMFTVVPYHVDGAGLVDMDEVAALAREHKPTMIIAGWSARSPGRESPSSPSPWSTSRSRMSPSSRGSAPQRSMSTPRSPSPR